ncbi:MAG: LamG-like jellyroll fold domain-containing protein, partial [Stackebrandtia sp.]
TAEARAPQAVPDGQWTALWCVRDGSRLTLYINGVEAETADNADVDISNADPVMIGGKHSGRDTDQFRGDLDDVRLDIASG